VLFRIDSNRNIHADILLLSLSLIITGFVHSVFYPSEDLRLFKMTREQIVYKSWLMTQYNSRFWLVYNNMMRVPVTQKQLLLQRGCFDSKSI